MAEEKVKLLNEQKETKGNRLFNLLTSSAQDIFFRAETHELAALAIIAMGWGSYGLQKASNNAIILSPGIHRKYNSRTWFKNTFEIDLPEFAWRNKAEVVKILRSMKASSNQVISGNIVRKANMVADLIERTYNA